MLKTHIDASVLDRLRANLEAENLESYLGPTHSLLRTTKCAITGEDIYCAGYMVEGLGYVGEEGAAVLMIRGLVDHIDELTDLKDRAETTAQIRTRAAKLRVHSLAGDNLSLSLLHKIVDIALGQEHNYTREELAEVVKSEPMPTANLVESFFIGDKLTLAEEQAADAARIKELQEKFAALVTEDPGQTIADLVNARAAKAPLFDLPFNLKVATLTPDGSELVVGGSFQHHGAFTIADVSLVSHESIPENSIALVTDMSITPQCEIRAESVSLIDNIGTGAERGSHILREDGPHELIEHSDGTFGERMDPTPGLDNNNFIKGGRGPGVVVPGDEIRAEQARVAALVKPKKIRRGENGLGWRWLTKADGVSLSGEVEIARGAKVDIRNLPDGTIVRFADITGPVVPLDDPRVRPVNGYVCAADAGLVRTQFDIDHGIIAPPAIARKWSGHHVVPQPEFDISSLPPEDQPVFEGYQPGPQRVFANASDVYRYEREVGGVMEAVEAAFAESDIDEFGKVITDDDVQKEKGRQRDKAGVFSVATTKGNRA